MAALKFASSHNMVVFLDKPTESDGFEQIVNFLNAHPIKYALTINPIIYTSCIEQFWATTKVKTINGEVQIQALLDKKKVIITVTSVRSDLQLEDAEGTECLPNATIFEQLTLMEYENLTLKLTFYKAFFSPQWKFLIHIILQCFSAKTTAWNEFSSTMASDIICLATNQKFNFSKNIFDNMAKNLEGGVKFLMYPRFVQVFLDKLVEGMSKDKEMYVTPSHTKKEEVGEGSDNPTNPHPTPTTTQTSTSKPKKKQSRRKQRKGTEDADKSIAKEAANVESVPTHSNDPLFSGEDRLKLNELMELCTKLQQRVLDLENAKISQDSKIAKLNKKVKKLEKQKRSRTPVLKRLRKVGRTARIKSFEDEGVLDEHEVEVEKVVSTAEVEVTTASATTTVDELTLAQTLIEIKAAKPKAVTTAATITTTADKDKGKAKMVEPEKPLKKKDQIMYDQEVALNLQAQLQAELEEEERLSRQKEEEANIALIESWNNVIESKRKEEQTTNSSLTKKAILVNTFVDYKIELQEESLKKAEAEVIEGSSKRVGEDLQQESTKKQKVDDDDKEE
ncbi:hypothetical protein Tco_0018097 [Tanacetum coccineum]